MSSEDNPVTRTAELRLPTDASDGKLLVEDRFGFLSCLHGITKLSTCTSQSKLISCHPTFECIFICPALAVLAWTPLLKGLLPSVKAEAVLRMITCSQVMLQNPSADL